MTPNLTKPGSKSARAMTKEQHFICPHCGEPVSMLLDLTSGSQHYFEDCEVCCNPIEISYRVEEGELVSFDARAA